MSATLERRAGLLGRLPDDHVGFIIRRHCEAKPWQSRARHL
ncbi:hypothetical protein ABS772_08665 [Methylorubrum podarium]|uniref:Uncharacterized protein n=1 Tax=Methylorubrum podarium TaxID=200476 RepID=A0ABV1QKT3_9HYPH